MAPSTAKRDNKMGDIVDRSALGNALQRISELERITMIENQENTARPEPGNRVNAVEELYNRFPSLRRANSSQSHGTSLPSTSGTTLTTPPSSSRARSTSRSSVLRNPNVRPSRHNRRSRNSSTNGSSMKTVLRDLVLVPDPNETTVPTHTRRVMLDSQGFVIHSFPFVREWDGRTLQLKIEEAFPKHTLLIFEFMKVSFAHNYELSNT